MKKIFLMMGIATVIFCFTSCNKEQKCECYNNDTYLADESDDETTREECEEQEFDLKDDYEDDETADIRCYWGN